MAAQSRDSSPHRRKGKTKTLHKLLREGTAQPKISDLRYEQLSLFHFLTLIVDIKYRNRYGEPIDRQGANNNSNRLTQLTPVEYGLDGITRRGLPDATN